MKLRSSNKRAAPESSGLLHGCKDKKRYFKFYLKECVIRNGWYVSLIGSYISAEVDFNRKELSVLYDTHPFTFETENEANTVEHFRAGCKVSLHFKAFSMAKWSLAVF